jgi:hypothetical protein
VVVLSCALLSAVTGSGAVAIPFVVSRYQVSNCDESRQDTDPIIGIAGHCYALPYRTMSAVVTCSSAEAATAEWTARTPLPIRCAHGRALSRSDPPSLSVPRVCVVCRHFVRHIVWWQL